MRKGLVVAAIVAASFAGWGNEKTAMSDHRLFADSLADATPDSFGLVVITGR